MSVLLIPRRKSHATVSLRIMEGAAKRSVEGEATETRETRKKAKVDYNEDRIAVAKKQVRNSCDAVSLFGSFRNGTFVWNSFATNESLNSQC